jgi:hypothetical protein
MDESKALNKCHVEKVVNLEFVREYIQGNF